ncbi:MAG TPA: hypothetical protein VGB38_06095 [bacterium]
MTKVERFAFVTCPFLFGMVLIFIGMVATKKRPDLAQGIILICSGIICVCLFAISSLLAKLIEKRESKR